MCSAMLQLSYNVEIICIHPEWYTLIQLVCCLGKGYSVGVA